MNPYRDNQEHIAAELERLDLLLERAVARFRRVSTYRAEAQFAGLYISDAEVDEIFAQRNGDTEEGRRDLEARIDEVTGVIAARVAASTEAGVPLRLEHLADVFGLGRPELDVIVLALAPELDLRYHRLFAYVQDDVNRKRPTVDLALRLFCRDESERLAYRRLFADVGPLVSIPLISRHEDAADRPAPLLVQSLKLEERVAEFLAGGDYVESRFAVRGVDVRWVAPQQRLEDVLLRSESRAKLEVLAGSPRENRQWTCVLYGPAGAGKKSAAEGVAAALGVPMLVLDVAATAAGEEELRTTLRAALREVRLYGGALYLDGWHRLREEGRPGEAAERMILEMLDAHTGPAFIAGEGAWRPFDTTRRLLVPVHLPLPDEGERVVLWRGMLSRCGVELPPDDLAYIASAFRFTGGRMTSAIERGMVRARLRGEADSGIQREDIVAGCREESSKRIITFARQITPRRTWEDLVLPREVMAQLREFCRQVRHRTTVYGTWGFDRKLSYGKGTVALFTGTSGTGKTLSAEVLARELGLDLFRVDLANVVSKYIGETEKNLERVFTDAHDANAILFFDEADALFGKRSDVKDAHDRYANIEINYLLQRVEEYEGVIILASNLSKNIDTAFQRRLHFSIEFPFPDEQYRGEIWTRIFPEATPVAEDVDMDFLARQFAIAGGSIRNVALAAAFHAADDGAPVSMRHLVLAMKREYQKLGKTCERSDFEKYYELVR